MQLNTGNLFNKIGFGLDTRWQDSFLFENRSAERIIEERITLDAQINYAIPSLKSVLKLGGTNITGNQYFSAPESGLIGSQYYISWVINN